MSNGAIVEIYGEKLEVLEAVLMTLRENGLEPGHIRILFIDEYKSEQQYDDGVVEEGYTRYIADSENGIDRVSLSVEYSWHYESFVGEPSKNQCDFTCEIYDLTKISSQRHW